MPAGDWRTINRDLAATRYSPLNQIDANNVATMTEAWRYELGGSSTAVPIVIDGTMYLPSYDRVVALDGATGQEIWSYTISRLPDDERPATASTRGVSYWPGEPYHDTWGEGWRNRSGTNMWAFAAPVSMTRTAAASVRACLVSDRLGPSSLRWIRIAARFSGNPCWDSI